VPGATDSSVPSPGDDPYPKEHPVRCIFAGNLLWKSYGGGANAGLVDKLNRLGESLARRGIRLYTMGTGDGADIDPRYVTHLGALPYDETWNYFYHADAGIEMVKTDGFMHNNESSKIYHYLRAGLPVVSEEGLPNNGLIEEAKLGFIVENGNPELMAEKIETAAHAQWDREYAVKFIVENHTWEKRALIYNEIIGG
jgi:glycosyltransferase involved in cell wall biosynthesis